MALRALHTLMFAVFAFVCAISAAQDKLPRFQQHMVRDRETPSSIAHDFNVKTKDFLMLNNFPDGVKLKPGQIVLVRQLKDGENVARESTYKAKKTEEITEKTKTVTKTETRSVSIKSNDNAASGAEETTARPTTDKAALTGPNGAKYELTGGGFHIVQKGQTFYRIALIYGLTVDQLKKLNNMTTTDIKVGQELKIGQ